LANFMLRLKVLSTNLKFRSTLVPKQRELVEKNIQIKVSYLLIDGREAKLTHKGTAARSFNIDITVVDIMLRVMLIRKSDLTQVFNNGFYDLLMRGIVGKDIFA